MLSNIKVYAGTVSLSALSKELPNIFLKGPPPPPKKGGGEGKRGWNAGHGSKLERKVKRNPRDSTKFPLRKKQTEVNRK